MKLLRFIKVPYGYWEKKGTHIKNPVKFDGLSRTLNNSTMWRNIICKQLSHWGMLRYGGVDVDDTLSKYRTVCLHFCMCVSVWVCVCVCLCVCVCEAECVRLSWICLQKLITLYAQCVIAQKYPYLRCNSWDRNSQSFEASDLLFSLS